MSHHKTLAVTSVLLSFFLMPKPAMSQFDAFELPPGIEKTQVWSQRKRTPAENLQRIESLRKQLETYFANQDWAAAQPVYKEYIGLLKTADVSDEKLASAYESYAELLRRLHHDAEADECARIGKTYRDKCKPYALKTYVLGMALDEFVKLPPPEGTSVKIKAVCSCDPEQSIETVSEADKLAKIVQCGFWQVGANEKVTAPLSMSIAGQPCTPDFRFVESGGVYRLMEISVSFYSSNFNSMKSALTDKFGQPTSSKTQNVTTEMGNIFSATNLIWNNEVSTIKLTNYDGTNLGRSRLQYVHKELYLTYSGRLEHGKADSRPHANDL